MMHKKTMERIRPARKFSDSLTAPPAISDQVNDHEFPSVGNSAGHNSSSIPVLWQPLQANLEISQPGDPLEQEADRIADHVMQLTDRETRVPVGMTSRVGSIQRKWVECQEDEKKEDEEE